MQKVATADASAKADDLAVKPFVDKVTIPFLTLTEKLSCEEKLGCEEKLDHKEKLGHEAKLNHEGFFCACPSSCAFNDSSP